MSLMVFSKLGVGYVSSTIYEITATVLIPTNSYLNPIFNSGLYRKIVAQVNRGRAWLSNILSNPPPQGDIPMVIINTNSGPSVGQDITQMSVEPATIDNTGCITTAPFVCNCNYVSNVPDLARHRFSEGFSRPRNLALNRG